MHNMYLYRNPTTSNCNVYFGKTGHMKYNSFVNIQSKLNSEFIIYITDINEVNFIILNISIYFIYIYIYIYIYLSFI